jgi:hypothetical protein
MTTLARQEPKNTKALLQGSAFSSDDSIFQSFVYDEIGQTPAGSWRGKLGRVRRFSPKDSFISGRV